RACSPLLACLPHPLHRSLLSRPPPPSTLFPYTTLFRSTESFNTSICLKLNVPIPVPAAFANASLAANLPAKNSIRRRSFRIEKNNFFSFSVKIRCTNRSFCCIVFLIRLISISSMPIPLFISYSFTFLFLFLFLFFFPICFHCFFFISFFLYYFFL